MSRATKNGIITDTQTVWREEDVLKATAELMGEGFTNIDITKREVTYDSWRWDLYSTKSDEEEDSDDHN